MGGMLNDRKDGFTGAFIIRSIRFLAWGFGSLIVSAGFTPSPAQAASFAGMDFTSVIDPGVLLEVPRVRCLRGDGVLCAPFEMADSARYRQILVLPTGYNGGEYAQFNQDFDRLVEMMSRPGPAIYSGAYANKILYIGYWLPGGAVDAPDAQFGAQVANHPVRGKALTLRLGDVHLMVSQLKASVIPALDPMGVAVLFNVYPEESVTANASPPSFIQKPYGVAKLTRRDLENPYVGAHELAHACLNFLDEYIERGMENLNISSIDVITPLALFNGTWGGWIQAIGNLFQVYTYKISEIIASNGNDNIDVTRYPSRVSTPGYPANEFEKEGGMFFGRGTYHDSGRNLMGSFALTAPDDGFAYDHSPAQRTVVQQAFEDPSLAPRANDRLRNAGPSSSWPANFGSDVHVLLFDGDKNHHFHPTRSYDVQVGWYERHWRACWWGPIPYPCYDDIWATAQKTVYPDRRSIELRTTQLYGLAGLAQNLICFLGLGEIKSGSQTFNLCQMTLDQMTSAFLPTLVFSMPYQDASVPTTQWFTTYYWRFRTNNQTTLSGWTSWGSFMRTF